MGDNQTIDARDISVSPVPAEIRTPIAISNRTEQRTPISNRNSRTPNNTSYNALNRYFLTKKQENTAIHKDKLETEKRKRASYERKKEKAKRRITALEKMEIGAVKKAKIRPSLENKYMSSDEECSDGFITHQPSWQSDKFAEYKRKLDSKFLDICST
ncbi:unnamed protein product [Mytilus edulis]|uniref:Uncharacterized protein n=1 Tax=Mytilus edulis TaxID=6550 RepID=A0A8S3Q6D8_MYTED|nr:unnamed protein product [Mytilus edulis]